MKFRTTPGWWLAFHCTWYIIAEFVAIFVYHHHGDADPTTLYIQLVWLFIMSLPIFIKPLARFCSMRTIWEK